MNAQKEMILEKTYREMNRTPYSVKVPLAKAVKWIEALHSVRKFHFHKKRVGNAYYYESPYIVYNGWEFFAGISLNDNSWGRAEKWGPVEVRVALVNKKKRYHIMHVARYTKRAWPRLYSLIRKYR